MVDAKHMIRIFRIVAALALALAVFGASPDPYPAATVVVYPLTVAGGGDPNGEVGSNIALLLSNKLADLGGLNVKPFTPGTTRPEYLDAALKLGADYYVTGYITPVGADVSVIVQVVSTYSGSVVYSTTALAHTFADVVSQADVVRAAILRHAGRGFAALDAPAPAPTSTNGTIAGKNGVNLTKALGRHNHGGPAASPSPGPSAGPLRTGRALVLQVGGDADPQARTYAASALALALHSDGVEGGLLPVTVEQGIAHAGQLCSANAGSSALYAPTLVLQHDAAGAASVQLDVTAYDCKATPLGRQTAVAPVPARGGVDSAIDQATSKVAAGFLKSTL